MNDSNVNIIATIVASVVATIVIALLAGAGGLTDFGIIVGVIVAFVVYYFVDKATKARDEEISKKIKEDNRRFESGEMTGEERKKYVEKQLKMIDSMYRINQLTLAEKEVLVKKYTGKSSWIDHYGVEFTVAASDKLQVDKAIKEQKKDAERDLMINTAFGNAIGGLGGAIVGAANSAKKSAEEAADLEAVQAVVEENYRKALKNSTKR